VIKTDTLTKKNAKKTSDVKFKTPLIKANAKKEGQENTAKSYVFPSSISAISSKVSEPKRYFFKDHNIFVTTKSKTDLFDEMMENKAKKSCLSSVSTAATAKKSLGTETNWYMSDKTKKCVRAFQDSPKMEPQSQYVANLDKNDPGRKKVRFIEDLMSTRTEREIGFYSDFGDKRDLKELKRGMLENNWEKKIGALKN
jgi:hypothetical protein